MSANAWTRPEDLRALLRRRWDQGLFLSALARDETETLFPFRLPCRGPASTELADEFDAVREWIAALRGEARLRIQWRSFTHRILGSQQVPESLWVDSIEDVTAWLGAGKEWARAKELLAFTRQTQPELLAWLRASPRNLLRALELHDVWPRLLSVVAWLREHPRPGIYLRQLDLPGVHTKWIETHRKILMDLLDVALPASALDTETAGTRQFERRFGFREKPERIRLRFLDPAAAVQPERLGLDLSLDAAAFARLTPCVRQVFITENEINFLSFPHQPDSLLLFGAGYGLDRLAKAHWLRDARLRYWGDIDTHGFAILDQLRAHFPHAESLCMDRETLLAFQDLWGREPSPSRRDLPRLHPAESELYDDLRSNRLGPNIRLEQEQISFSWFHQKLCPGP